MATSEDLKKLRQSFDGGDPFMEQPQIIVVRKRPKIVPDWVMDNNKTQEVINRSFPNWRTNRVQRLRAGRWSRVITLYFRQDLPHNQVVEEMGIGYKTLISLIRGIRRAGEGRRSDTGKRRRVMPYTIPPVKALQESHGLVDLSPLCGADKDSRRAVGASCEKEMPLPETGNLDHGNQDGQGRRG